MGNYNYDRPLRFDISARNGVKGMTFDYEPIFEAYLTFVQNRLNPDNPNIFEQVVKMLDPSLCILQTIDFENLLWTKKVLE